MAISFSLDILALLGGILGHNDINIIATVMIGIFAMLLFGVLGYILRHQLAIQLPALLTDNSITLCTHNESLRLVVLPDSHSSRGTFSKYSETQPS